MWYRSPRPEMGPGLVAPKLQRRERPRCITFLCFAGACCPDAAIGISNSENRKTLASHGRGSTLKCLKIKVSKAESEAGWVC